MSVISDVQVLVQTNGVSGPRGNSILSGDTAPDDSLGFDGDYYINVADYPTSATFYGPKVDGAWPASGITLTSGSGPSPSDTVTPEETFAETPDAGTAAEYSRGDHTHGTPPTTGLLLNSGSQVLTGNFRVTGEIWGQDTPSVPLGYKAWAFSPRYCSSSSVPAAGTQYLSAIEVPVATTVTTMYWGVSTIGSVVTANANWVGLYDANGTLVSNAVNVDADMTSISRKIANIGTTNLNAGVYYASFIFNTTSVQIPRVAGFGGPTMINGSLTGANLLFCTNGTNKTTMPMTINMANNLGGQGYWAALA